MVSTSKYTWWNFIPLNLLSQFTTKLPNLYFLVIMFMQMIDRISISDGQPAMLPPLAFVVIISMLKDGYEDYQRHTENSKENYDTTLVWDRRKKDFLAKYWKDVKVGDFVKVRDEEFFPADMVVLRSSDEQGIFYVETKNLDGETNLKVKAVPSDV